MRTRRPARRSRGAAAIIAGPRASFDRTDRTPALEHHDFVTLEPDSTSRPRRYNSIMQSVKKRTKVEAGGAVRIVGLPFAAGSDVEVVVTATTDQEQNSSRYPLRGLKPYQFDNPFEPVAADDWEAAK